MLPLLPAARAFTLALLAAVVLAAPASAHPGHHAHAGLPGVTSPFAVTFPGLAPTAGGLASENVEFVRNFPQHTDTAGARKLGNFFYITTERDLTIYDVSKPLEPRQVGSLRLPDPGTPVFTEEDPDTNGRILLVSNAGKLSVIDVSDKTAPKLLSTLASADNHTITCVLGCTWAYGSEGLIVDLRDPANPRKSGRSWQTLDIESEHDVTEVSPGIVVTSTQPLKLLDARQDPERPTVLASGPKEKGRFVHANLWPNGATDDFLLVGGEAQGPACSESISATFSTWDARAWRETGAIRQVDEFRLRPGQPTEGRAPESSYCVHWFDPHPNYRNGGVVTIGWYEHGTHFLRIGRDGKISEVGWFLGSGGQSSAAYWIDERTVYVADYLRGLDVLRFKGDVSAPPSDGAAPTSSEPGTGATPDEQPGAGPTQDGAPSSGQRPGAGSSSGSLLRSFRVARRLFGGDRRRPLGITFQVDRPARVVLTVKRGKRLVRRIVLRRASARRTYRLRLAARRLPPGRYRVRIEARSGTERAVATALARRRS
jgi:hypothetical protein